jgi:hypothetical protein
MVSTVRIDVSTVLPLMLPIAYGVNDPVKLIVDDPTNPASAPSSGVFVTSANDADPSPLSEAVSSKSLTVKLKLAAPLPEEINSPAASATVNVMVVLPVVVTPPTAEPTAETRADASLMADIPPALRGSAQLDGAKCPPGMPPLNLSNVSNRLANMPGLLKLLRSPDAIVPAKNRPGLLCKTERLPINISRPAEFQMTRQR